MFSRAAKYYLKNGLNCIVTNAVKQSLYDWKRYQSELITIEEIDRQLQHPSAAGMAVICGAISGGLEVIDIDLKYAIDETFYTRFCDAVGKDILDKLYIIKTKSGGYHWYYRCEVIEGNEKLAWRPKTEEELKENPQGKKLCLIETRGEAGYVIAPPTPGYEAIAKKLNIITIEEREAIWSAARSMNEVVEVHAIDPGNRPTQREYGISPFDDYNNRGNITELLQKHNWTVVSDDSQKTVFKRPGKTDSRSSGNFNKEKNWFSVFTTNSVFETEKAYLPYAVFAILECDGDFKKAVKALADLGYGEKRVSYGHKLEQSLFRRKQDGMTEEALVTYLVQREGKTVEEAKEMVTVLEKQWGKKICTFWDIDSKGRPVINRARLNAFLFDTGGFALYFHNTSTIYRIVRIVDGRVEESSSEQVKKFIKQYILNLPLSFDGGICPEELLEVVLKGASSYFCDAFFEFLDARNINFLKDDADTAYFPFKNGVVEIKRNGGVTLRSYGDIKKYVWANEVIDFEIQIDQDFDPSLCEYYRFLENISGKDAERLTYAISLIGYMLHSWKNPSRPYAPIMAEETDDEKKGGGTGKGIFIKAIGKLIPVVTIDGKNFKIDKNFAFQRVGFDTRLIVIEDCPKNIEFEKFYPTITEGITIEKKNKDEIFLNYAESPKIAFTTNYSISQEAEHSKRRQRVFEFAAHYNSRFTPEDEFKHKFFDDWNRDEWTKFYNLFFMCVGAYLDGGIKAIDNSDKMKRKHIKLAYGEEFLDWWDDYLQNGRKNWAQFTQEYNSFLKSNEYDKKDYSIKRFRKALTEASSSMGYVYEARKNRQNCNLLEFRVMDS
jgi:hypothetical protein